MSEMIERMAKLIADEAFVSLSHARKVAPLLLMAIREPTPDMLAAVKPEPAHLYGVGGRDEAYQEQMKVAVAVDRAVANGTWQAMIDSALSGQSGEG